MITTGLISVRYPQRHDSIAAVKIRRQVDIEGIAGGGQFAVKDHRSLDIFARDVVNHRQDFAVQISQLGDAEIEHPAATADLRLHDARDVQRFSLVALACLAPTSSLLEASVEQDAGAITAVRVAGEARLLGEGWLTLEASLPRRVGGVPGGGVPDEAGGGGDR